MAAKRTRIRARYPPPGGALRFGPGEAEEGETSRHPLEGPGDNSPSGSDPPSEIERSGPELVAEEARSTETTSDTHSPVAQQTEPQTQPAKKESSSRRRRRAYQRAGLYSDRGQLLDRVRSDDVPDSELSGLELAARETRRELIEAVGGDSISPQRRIVVDVVLGSLLAVASVDRFLFEEGGASAIVDRRSRQVKRAILDRQRLADSLVKQLGVLGLDSRESESLAFLRESRKHIDGNKNGNGNG